MLLSLSGNGLEAILSDQWHAKKIRLKKAVHTEIFSPEIKKIGLFLEASSLEFFEKGKATSFSSIDELFSALSKRKFETSLIVFSSNLMLLDDFLKCPPTHCGLVFPVLSCGKKIVCLPATGDAGWLGRELILEKLQMRYPGLSARLKQSHNLYLNAEQLGYLVDAVRIFELIRTRVRPEYHPHYAVEFDAESGRLKKFYIGGVSVPVSVDGDSLRPLAPRLRPVARIVPGFVLMNAELFHENGEIHGAAVDTGFETAAVRATYECIERFTLQTAGAQAVFSPTEQPILVQSTAIRSLQTAAAKAGHDLPNGNISWLKVANLKHGTVTWLPACLFSLDASTRIWSAQKLRPQGSSAHRNHWFSTNRSILELVERDVITKAYVKREMRELGRDNLPHHLVKRLGEADINVRLYLCNFERAPVVLAFLFNGEYLGCTGQSAGYALESATESAIFNALGVYHFRRANSTLFDVRSSWCFDIHEKQWGGTWMPTANMEALIDCYAPFICHLENQFNTSEQMVSVTCAWSEVAVAGYSGDAEETAQALGLSGAEHSLLEREGHFISLEAV